jgi:hypothetical protein
MRRRSLARPRIEYRPKVAWPIMVWVGRRLQGEGVTITFELPPSGSGQPGAEGHTVLQGSDLPKCLEEWLGGEDSNSCLASPRQYLRVANWLPRPRFWPTPIPLRGREYRAVLARL